MKNPEISSSRLLPDEARLVCAFSHRQLGNVSLFYGDTKNALSNRERFLTPLDVDYRDLVCAKQIHSDGIWHVTEQDKGRGALSYEASLAHTDALITDTKKLPLAVFTADCLSVFLFDPIKPAIGLVHAGWRGSKEHITLKTVQRMQEVFRTDPFSLRVSFGPAIGACCYEINQETSSYFTEGLVKRNNRTYLDLVAVNRIDLQDAGVKSDNLVEDSICTSCYNDDFFSYRKEGKTSGRIMSVMMLR
ncbi:MAG: peptidoglycan editing factor PgeF [Candidatus Omnitrophota bacterium]